MMSSQIKNLHSDALPELVRQLGLFDSTMITKGILINTLITKSVESIAGLGFTCLGIPVYFKWKKKRASRSSSS